MNFYPGREKRVRGSLGSQSHTHPSTLTLALVGIEGSISGLQIGLFPLY